MKVADGINAARMMIPKCFFDRDNTAEGLECLRQYRQDWDEKRKTFRDAPRHDYTSHAADAFRYLAIGLQNRETMHKPPQQVAVNDYNPFAL
jgi:phage terminase large subunit